jgi:hypothetical protein
LRTCCDPSIGTPVHPGLFDAAISDAVCQWIGTPEAGVCHKSLLLAGKFRSNRALAAEDRR